LEVVPGIHRIDGVNANCYLVVDKELILVDTGLPRGANKVLRYITDDLHRPLSDLKTIVLTHCHMDHIGNAEAIKRATGAEIAAHGDDAPYMDGRKRAPRPKGVLRFLFRLLSPAMRVEKFKVDIVLAESDKVGSMDVIHVPGHTPGSIALFDPARKLLFSGDVLRYQEGELVGPPDRFTMDLDESRRSTEKLKSLDFETLCAGHGEPLKLRDSLASKGHAARTT
jgi:glyoxylase-like metal-dependent hydrolase (beta-lactamase superfamily II)